MNTENSATFLLKNMFHIYGVSSFKFWNACRYVFQDDFLGVYQCEYKVHYYPINVDMDRSGVDVDTHICTGKDTSEVQLVCIFLVNIRYKRSSCEKKRKLWCSCSTVRAVYLNIVCCKATNSKTQLYRTVCRGS